MRPDCARLSALCPAQGRAPAGKGPREPLGSADIPALPATRYRQPARVVLGRASPHRGVASHRPVAARPRGRAHTVRSCRARTSSGRRRAGGLCSDAPSRRVPAPALRDRPAAVLRAGDRGRAQRLVEREHALIRPDAAAARRGRGGGCEPSRHRRTALAAGRRVRDACRPDEAGACGRAMDRRACGPPGSAARRRHAVCGPGPHGLCTALRGGVVLQDGLHDQPGPLDRASPTRGLALLRLRRLDPRHSLGPGTEPRRTRAGASASAEQSSGGHVRRRQRTRRSPPRGGRRRRLGPDPARRRQTASEAEPESCALRAGGTRVDPRARAPLAHPHPALMSTFVHARESRAIAEAGHRRWWIAAAAALGLLVGLVGGGFEHLSLDGGSAHAADAARATRGFLSRYVEADGRVVRRDQGGDSVSEGQAYGLLLAQSVGDHRAFARIWEWTRTHLQSQDGLLAYLSDGAGAVRDPTPASDADVLAAWALSMASGPDASYYHAQARRLAGAVLVGETAARGGLLMLAAGPWATGDP